MTKLLLFFGAVIVFVLIFTSVKRFIIFVVGITVWYAVAKNPQYVPFAFSLVRYIIPLGILYLLFAVEDDHDDY